MCPTERGGDPAVSRTLAAFRAAENSGFDRVVFDFGNGPLPAYVVEQAREFVGPSGMPTPVQGTAFIGVRFPRAGEMGSYRGPRSVLRPTPSIAEIKIVEDFEGVLVFGIGLDRHNCPRVTVLSSPARLVLDFPWRT
ncbi:MAG TPA: hypothetical protein VFM93_06635 [Candidatus Limnocylindria bacterium]|nr:hypothetical protein [Candidatus Limnocylindria bacterium]